MEQILPWMEKVIWPDDQEASEMLSNLNYRAGYALGLVYKIRELEEQLELALQYQREIDARIADEQNVPKSAPTMYQSGFKDAKSWIAKRIRGDE
jgi:hypothetical protein